MNTKLSIFGDRFHLNGRPVYSEIPGANPACLGLLWNQRLIQGVYSDRQNPGLLDAEANTNALIAALPEWYRHGLRAITVGFQGGWPVGLTDPESIDCNPIGPDGKSLESAFATRMDRIIRAADAIGMVVIVSLLYWAQCRRMAGEDAVVKAIRTGSRFIRDNGYSNVILEIANEYNIGYWEPFPIIRQPENMARLISMARELSGGAPTGCSGGGGLADPAVIDASDVVLIHSNGLTRGQYYDFVRRVQALAGGKPVLCNEDSPCFTRVDVALETGTSWGYYNNYSKQIPPADYGIAPGEDLFFARRMARAVNIPLAASLPFSDQFYLQGLEARASFAGQRAIRLAAEYPETISHVDFYLNGQKLYRSYDEPFFLFRDNTWLCRPVPVKNAPQSWRALVHLSDGRIIEKVRNILPESR